MPEINLYNPPPAKVSVTGNTNLKDQKSVPLKDSIMQILNDENTPKAEKMKKACSMLVDLWLENTKDPSQVNAILTLLKEDMGENSELLSEFTNKYLYPAINTMKKITGADLVAEKYDLKFDVKSPDNLQKYKMEFYTTAEDPNIKIRFGVGVRVMYGSDNVTNMDLTLNDKTKSVEIKETDKGFDMNITNQDGSVEVLHCEYQDILFN